MQAHSEMLSYRWRWYSKFAPFLDAAGARRSEACQGLASQEVLRKCGYFDYTYGGEEASKDDPCLQTEDEFARAAGDMACCMVSHRQRRLHFMTSSWPNRHLRSLCGPYYARTVAKDFHGVGVVQSSDSRSFAPKNNPL